MRNHAKNITSIGSALLLVVGVAACSSNNTDGAAPSVTASVAASATPNTQATGSSAATVSPEPRATGSYTSTQDNFTIDFPSVPTVTPISQQSSGVTITGNVYSSDVHATSGFIVSVSKYELPDPNAAWDDRTILDGALNGMISSSGGTAESSSNDGTLAGYPSAQVVLKSSNVVARAQLVLRDRTLYNIMAADVTEEEFADFVASFAFLN